jgi:DNA-binding transcriptional ArsR family regulator
MAGRRLSIPSIQAIICVMAQTCKLGRRRGRACCSLEGLIDPALFRALGDPNRVALLVRLSQRNQPTRVTEAADCCPVDLSVVSRHLAVLRDAGVIRAAKLGREVHYTVSPDLAGSLRALADALDACCPPPDSSAEAKEGTS